MANYRPITDVIFCARTKTKDPKTGKSYYGAYPSGFLEKARLILGASLDDCIYHICGGLAREYNGKKGGINLYGFGKNDVTIDIDPLCQPDIVGDVRKLDKLVLSDYQAFDFFEITNYQIYLSHTPTISIRTPKSIIIDRPYTPEDADNYRCGREVLPDLNKLLKDSLNLVEKGRLVGVLDYMFPSAENGQCVGVYPVIAGTNCRVRVFTVWRSL